MNVNSKIVRLSKILLLLGSLQGFPNVFSANTGNLVSKQKDTYLIAGKVVDANGDPMVGVNIVEKNTVNGIITDIDGNFSLSVSPNSILQVSFIGYQSKEIKLNGEKEIKITLQEDSHNLDELVVVGYGTQKKVNLTGAVSQVTSEVLDNRPVPNLTRGLQGSIPNLNIKMVDGSPTRKASYNVRGTTSIGAGGSALVLIDGVEGDPNMINPNDVESVSVLKDASSAAIYGSRAAFGVVLITTKKPQKDKIRVDVSSNFSINQRTVTPNIITSGYEWAKNFDEAFNAWYDYKSHPISVNNIFPFSMEYLDELKHHSEDPSLPEVVFNEEKGRYEYFGNTDWYDVINKKNIPSTEQAISVSGGSEKVNFLISGRYYYQDGIFNFNPDKYNKYNLRAKGDLQVTNWLKLSNNFEYNSYTYKYPMFADGDGNIWRQFEHQGYPMAVLTNPDGTYTHTAVYTGVAVYKEGSSGSDLSNFQIRNTIGLEAKALQNKLTFKGDFTYSKTSQEETRRNNYIDYSIAPGQTAHFGKSQLRKYDQDITYYSSNITGEYSDTFADKHDFHVLLGYNIESSSTHNLNTSRDGLLSEDKPDFNLMDGLNYSITGGGSEWAFLGLFYRLSYAYDSRYLFEFNGRYDGSSKFPTDQRFGFFPSISGGWRISEESFMSPAKSWLDNLKLRASWGSLGNGNVSPYRYMEIMNVAKTSVVLEGVQKTYTSLPAVIPAGLTWEKSTTFDIGMDMNVLENRLGLVFDWYNRNTTDMFTLGQPLPNVFGATVPYGNYADMNTKGWEITLSWNDQFDLAGKPFKYNFTGSLWDSRSHITRYNNPTKTLSATYYEGCEVGEIWGYVTEGFFTDENDIANHADQSFLQNSNNKVYLPGDLKFADLNGDNKINSGKNTVDDPGDRRIIGNNSPRYQFGFTVGGSWGGFGLSAFFQGVGKRDWYFAGEAGLFWGPYNRPYGYQPVKMMEDIWSEENPDGYFPRFRGYTALNSNRSLGAPQTRYLQDVSYIRLKSLTLDYTLPKQFISKAGLVNAKVFLTGQNLWTASGLFKHTDNFDPEVIENPQGDLTNGSGQGYAYPMLKSYTIGINLTF